MIWAENNNKGSSFIFSLPLFGAGDGNGANKKHGKILVIDDEEPLIRSIEIGLAIHGDTDVVFALTGAEGISLLITDILKVKGSVKSITVRYIHLGRKVAMKI